MTVSADGARSPQGAAITDLAAGARHLALRFYLPSLLATTGMMMLVPTLPLYLAEQTDSVTLVTVVIAAAAIGGLVWNIPAGLLLQRWGEWRGFIVGLGHSSVGPVVLAVVGGLWLPFVGCLIGGAGQSTRLLARQAYARRVIDTPIRGRLMSLYGGLGRVALLVGPLAGGLIGDAVGFRPAFAVAGALVVAGLVATFAADARTRRPGRDPERRGAAMGDAEPVREPGTAAVDPVDPVARPGGGVAGMRAVAVRHGRVIALAGLGQLGVAVIRIGRLTLVPLYGASIGLDVGDVGVVVAIAGGLDLMLFPLAGWLMDSFGRLFAIVPSFVTMSLGLAVLPLADSFRALVAVSLLIGFGNGIGAGTMLTLATDLAPIDNPAAFLSLLRILADLGRIAGPVIVGVVADRTDLGTSSVVLAGVGAATAALFVFAIGDPTRRAADQAL